MATAARLGQFMIAVIRRRYSLTDYRDHEGQNSGRR